MFNANGSVQFTATPFGTYTGGVRVATGDVTGDGIADIVVGTNSGGIKAIVRIVDGKSGQVRPGDLSAGPWYYGVASVAVGDVTGDGIGDIAVGSDDGGPVVRIYRGGDFVLLSHFLAGPKTNYWGRTEVALADLTGDGIADLAVTGLYPNGVRVSGFNGLTLRPNVTPGAAFTAFTMTGRGFEGAPNLAAGDVNGDGYADLVFGAGSWSSTRVLALSGQALVQSNLRKTLADFAPSGNAYGFGVRVAVRDWDGDGIADILTGAGKGRGSKVRVYLGKTLTPIGMPPIALDFDAYPGFTGGVFVG